MNVSRREFLQDSAAAVAAALALNLPAQSVAAAVAPAMIEPEHVPLYQQPSPVMGSHSINVAGMFRLRMHGVGAFHNPMLSSMGLLVQGVKLCTPTSEAPDAKRLPHVISFDRVCGPAAYLTNLNEIFTGLSHHFVLILESDNGPLRRVTISKAVLTARDWMVTTHSMSIAEGMVLQTYSEPHCVWQYDKPQAEQATNPFFSLGRPADRVGGPWQVQP